MPYKSFTYCVVFFFLCVLKVESQDVKFSQFYGHPLYLNPGMAGTELQNRLYLNYRSEQPLSYGDFVTYNVGFDTYMDVLHGGLGLYIMNDRQGDGLLNAYTFNLIYSYIFQVSPNTMISAGLNANYNYRNINTGSLIFPDMVDETDGSLDPSRERIGTLSQTYWDFSFGLVFWHNDFYGGIAVDHLSEPDMAFSEDIENILYRKYTFHFGITFDYYTSYYKWDYSLSPNIIYTFQNEYHFINIGGYYEKEPFSIGAWINTNESFNINSIIIAASYTFDVFTLSYSYDIPVNKFYENNLISGAHEVTFLMNFKYNSKRKKIKAIKCPKF